MECEPTYKFDYYSLSEAEQFTFFRVPKVLFTNERFQPLSAESKILYGILLDRMSLSVKNKWLDSKSRVYIVYTNKQIQEIMGCADKKATKLLRELEAIGLIERDKKLLRADHIFVKNFSSLSSAEPVNNGDFDELLKSRLPNRENDDHRIVENTIPESSKPRRSNTDLSEPDSSYINRSFIPEEPVTESWSERMETKELEIKQQIEYDILLERFEKEQLDELVDIMLSVYFNQAETIRIGRKEELTCLVHRMYNKIDFSCIEQIILNLKNNTTKIKDMKAYLIKCLYNAPQTKHNQVKSEVQHDMEQYKAGKEKSYFDDERLYEI